MKLREVVGRAESGDELVLQASDVHRTRTGTHARVDVGLNGTVLAYSAFNVDRDEDRVRLANRAHARLGALGQVWTAHWLQRALDAFCRDLWERWVETDALEPLQGECRELEYVLRPYVLDGGGTILFGGPGTGKTYLATLWARLIERGDGRFWPVRRRPVVYLQLERSARLFARRIALVNRALGYPDDLPLLAKIARGRRLADIADGIRSQLQPGTVVFLDSISRAGAGSLKEDETANQIIDTLNSISDTWVALAHTSHAQRDAEDAHAYGSVHFQAGADVLVHLVSQHAPFDRARLGLSLRVMPGSNDVVAPPELLAMEFDDRGLRAIRRAAASEFTDLVPAARSTAERAAEY
ncbi:MAG: AAA family ATPase, partial [Armatimonadota bacterium]|nr:AAA family ATPase [Armatimonadota bacterium]